MGRISSRQPPLSANPFSKLLTMVVEKFVPSLESLSSLGLEGRNLGCPRNFGGMSRTPRGVQKVCAKKFVCVFRSRSGGWKVDFPVAPRAAPRMAPSHGWDCEGSSKSSPRVPWELLRELLRSAFLLQECFFCSELGSALAIFVSPNLHIALIQWAGWAVNPKSWSKILQHYSFKIFSLYFRNSES